MSDFKGLCISTDNLWIISALSHLEELRRGEGQDAYKRLRSYLIA